MKFAIITDTHIGPPGFYRGTNRILSHLSETVVLELVETLNRQKDLAFISQLGDLSQDDVRYPSAEFDRANFQRALWYFKKFDLPVYHTVGNHDRENLTYDDLCQLLQIRTLHYSVDAAGYHCIYLYTRHFNHERMIIEPEQIAWLRDDLSQTQQPTLVFMHHPISDQDLTGCFWFEGLSHKAFVENREEVRAILEASGKVRAVFNGHLHRNNMWVHNNIPYFTIQSCVEDVDNSGRPSKSFAVVTLDSDSISVQIHGTDATTYMHRFD